MIESIYTLDARDNIYLDVIKGYFNLNENQIKAEINNTFQYLVSILKNKNISYQELKNALVPSERKEIALVFDTLQIESNWYGLPVMDNIIPLLDKNSTNSILAGDYIGNNELADRLFIEFLQNIISVNKINYSHHSQYYIVYINNLSTQMVDNLNKGLLKYSPYIGYFDLTYSSFIKTYISTILVRVCLKSKLIIIQGHEDDVDNEENINMSGYPFEKYGYTCKSIQSLYYSLFLSYKIERQVFEGFESDTLFSLNAITDKVFDITDFKLIIEENKLKYLITEKRVNIERAGLLKLTKSEIERLIKEKIDRNYIYNLSFSKQHETLKFNIIIETLRMDNNLPYKLTVALEYKPSKKVLRLITMF